MKRLYLIIGETGAGKDTVVDAVCKKTGFKKVVSYSDAPIRPDQKDGIDHIFVTPEEFDRIMATCQTIAYTKIGADRRCYKILHHRSGRCRRNGKAVWRRDRLLQDIYPCSGRDQKTANSWTR